MNKPIMKKLLLQVLPALVVLIIIAIIIFTVDSPNPGNSNPQAGTTFPFSGDILKVFEQAPQYHEKLNHARELFKEGDYKSLEEARKTIDQLKEIVVIPELKELEMKIDPRISLLNRDFDKHYNDAIDYFYKEKKLDKAVESIQKAKEIYTTKELLDLEARIEKEMKDRGIKRKKR